MLHRSFKAGKCKISLKLAVSRIKLLKNKRDAQLKQMKRELAQLLEAGQEQTARIRVEHVVREEKTMAAYDLIEIYCELLVARLPIIESQKNCPIDLKEAISTIMFASPRCADIPELMDIRKHFTGKYGKEFVASALELRPDCGVSRTIVEKLSATAPDGETKIKILTAIAQEHHIKWDPKSFEEKDSKPPEDLLNGSITFESASKMHVPPTVVQKYESDDIPRSSLSTPSFASTNVAMPTHPYPEPKPSESGTLERKFGHQLSEDENSNTSNRNWNMEFKDATSAAQAAAESAERASMAARAAAELASRGKIIRQYSTEPHESFSYDVRDEESEKSTYSVKPPVANSVLIPHDSLRSVSHGVSSRTQNPQENLQELEHGTYVSTIHDDILVNNSQKTNRYSHKSSSEVLASENQKSERARGDSSFDRSGEEEIDKEYDRTTTFPPVSTTNHMNDTEHFSINSEEVNTERGSEQLNSNNPGVVFDDYGLEEDCTSDVAVEYNGQESYLYVQSPVRKLPSHLLPNADIWSPRQNMNKPLERPDARPTFDESDGMNSESEEDTDRSHHSTGSFYMEKESTEDNRMPTSHSFSNYAESEKAYPESNQETEETELRMKNLDDLNSKPSTENSYSLISESGQELNLGSLTGGLRNKGYIRPPYTREHSSDTSHLSRQKASEDTPTIIEETVNSEAGDVLNHKTQIEIRKESKFIPPKTFFDSDSDDEEEVLPRKPVARKGLDTGKRLSWRTKNPSTEESERGVPLKNAASSEVSVTSEFGTSRKPSSASSSKPMPELRESIRISEVISKVEQPSNTLSKKNQSGSTENPETSSSFMGSESRENSLKIAGRVHRKLPDYDTFTAHFESLRSNRG